MANNTIEIKITASNAQAIAALKQVADAANSTVNQVKNAGSQGANSFSPATSSGKGFMGTLSEVGMAAAGIYATFQTLKGLVSTVFGTGFDFSKDMETNQLGMAGILTSMSLIDGKAMDFNQAMSISGDMMQKLQKDAMRTAASTQELVNAYRAVLSPGLNAGMSLDEIRQVTVTGVNALKSLNVPLQQTVQEMRDLMQGGITASGSTLATNLGITDADIAKAKASSEGLFKFLMDRMEGFKESAKRYPDTMQGSIDQLKEMWTMASAKFTSAFEEPVKDGLKAITALIGTVNTETGDFEVNPAILTFLDEVKGGYRDVKGLIRDVKNMCGNTFDGDNESAGNLYKTLKNLVSILEDLGRISLQISLPGMKQLGDELDREITRIEWLTDKAKTLLDYLARLSGAKVGETPTNSSWDDRTRGDRDYVPPGLPPAEAPRVTSKYDTNSDSKKIYQEAKEALEETYRLIEADGEVQKQKLNKDKERLEQQKDNMSVDDYHQQITAIELALKTIPVTVAQQKIEAAQGTAFKDQTAQNSEISKLNQGLTKAQGELDNATKNVEDLNNLVSKMDWGKTNTDYTNRELVQNSGEYKDDLIKAAGEAGINPLLLAAVIKQESGFRQYNEDGTVLSSSAGAKGLAQLMPDTARSLGVEDISDPYQNLLGGAKYLAQQLETFGGNIDKALAAYNAGPQAVKDYNGIPPYEETRNYVASIRANMNHEDIGDGFAAKNGQSTNSLAYQIKQLLGDYGTKSGADYNKQVLEVIKEVGDLDKEVSGLKGDDSQQLKAEVQAKYAELIRKFKLNLKGALLDKALKNVEDAIAIQENRIDFSQEQKDLELANIKLNDSQKNLFIGISNGSKTIAEATEQYSIEYQTGTSEIIAKMTTTMNKATPADASKIKAEIEKIPAGIQTFVENAVKEAQTALNQKTSLIDVNSKMTNMQKTDAKQELESQYYTDMSNAYSQAAAKIQAIAPQLQAAGVNPETIIRAMQKLALYNAELGRTKELAEKVEIAGKQAFEDGLLTFLTDGITKCKSLGEAFLNLANTVLSAIQKVYAEAITKDIMKALGLGSSGSSGSSSKYSFNYTNLFTPFTTFAEGGSMDSGQVKGPGTGTSDSILAYLGNFKKFVGISDGEYVVKNAAVKKFGTDFFDKLNAGLIPGEFFKIKEKFARGGLLNGEAVVNWGTQFLSDINSGRVPVPMNLPRFAQGGAVKTSTGVSSPQELAATLAAGDTNIHLKNVNVFDMEDIGRYMSGRAGEKIFINHMKNNAKIASKLIKF